MHITQNGRPPQNPAAPEEMLSASPSTNMVMINDPSNPEIFSSSVLFITLALQFMSYMDFKECIFRTVHQAATMLFQGTNT